MRDQYVLSTGFFLTGGQYAALVIKRWHSNRLIAIAES